MADEATTTTTPEATAQAGAVTTTVPKTAGEAAALAAGTKAADAGDKRFSQADIDRAISQAFERGVAKVKTDADEAAAKQRGEFEKLYNEIKPRADRLPAIEERAKAMLNASVPEAFRDLLPDGPLEMQLDWAAKAQAKGLFTPATTAPVKPTPAGQAIKPAEGAAIAAGGATEPEPITPDELTNISAERLADPKFVERLKHQLSKHRRP